MIRFGQPITLEKYFEDHRIRPQHAYNELLSELSVAMESLMIHITPSEHYEEIRKSWRVSRERFDKDLLLQLESDRALIKEISAHPERWVSASTTGPEIIIKGHAEWGKVFRPLHILPERLTDFIAENALSDRDFVGSIRFVATIAIYPLFYLLYILLLFFLIRCA